MGFGRIQWLAVLLPAASVGLFEFFRHQLLAHNLPGWLGTGWAGNVVGALVVAAIVFVFVRVFVGILRRLALEVSRSREEAAVAAERGRIAREMHDNTAQALFYLNVQLHEVGDLIVAGESDRALGELRTAEGHLDDAYQQVRTVITDLKRHAELEGFDETIRHAVTGLAERLGLQVTCEVEERASVLPASSRKHLLAIIQEALANAHRHGRPETATVRVKGIGNDVMVEVSDDGGGFDRSEAPPDGCHGLAIMQERAQIMGGQLSLDSAPGRGTRVTIHLPEALS